MSQETHIYENVVPKNFKEQPPPSSRLYWLCVKFKRLGEDRTFFGAFAVFICISVIFREFCLVVMEFFVNLPAKGW